ncbi:hypothetical protein FOZG_11645 [Fusarium oxysporum Fo47]|uniref:Uncharacterized protein n=1 Tax=Fusarium oxysporum Fo47 TaxID=660027 RepID=W9JUT8_FUSOX|nr:hypothetical protein FOZG_11645 [Fusarium oxysporum Fo47]
MSAWPQPSFQISTHIKYLPGSIINVSSYIYPYIFNSLTILQRNSHFALFLAPSICVLGLGCPRSAGYGGLHKSKILYHYPAHSCSRTDPCQHNINHHLKILIPAHLDATRCETRNDSSYYGCKHFSRNRPAIAILAQYLLDP